MIRIRFSVAILLLLGLLAGALPAHGQDAGQTSGPTTSQDNTITLDASGFGAVKQDALAAGAEVAYTVDLKAGDRVALDLQGETDSLQVASFAAAYGALELASPAPSNYLAWAPENGTYTITVKNTGTAPGGFTLLLAVSAAPLPAKKILTADANDQTIPVTAGEPFQVALDTHTGTGYTWTLGDFDGAVLTQDGDPATVLLGTMPGAPSQQIFTFTGVAPGTTALDFSYARAGSDPEQSYSVTIEVAAADDAGAPTEEPATEPAPQGLTLDADGKAEATGTLAPQGMASYVVQIAAEQPVQATVTPVSGTSATGTPADSNIILTVVGADGIPLQTDHVGASNFEQTVPVDQEYTFKVINFGTAAADYTFTLQVGAAAATPVAATPTPILPDPIKLDQGNVLVIPLAGNPTTGFTWLAAPSAEGILTSRGDPAYTSGSDLPGAGGYQIFTFDAAASGDVTLTFTYRQPWDETTPPSEQFVLPFTIVAPEPAPAAPPAPITIGEAENGSTVEVQTGGLLFVDLPGNPTTGYIWQVTDKDEAVLAPTDYEFRPSSAGMGAGGVEHFEFSAVAPGEVTLAFAQSRPWETDAEPTATYTVTVKVVTPVE
jgi:inhibitor of cysteine peptidase